MGDFDSVIVRACERMGRETPATVEVLPGGRNNRVACVGWPGERLLFKQYFCSELDPRDRLGSEFAFLAYAWASGCRRIPRPIWKDSDLRVGVFEFVPGPALHGREWQAAYFEQALNFLQEINADRGHRKGELPLAADAAFSIGEHCRKTQERLEQLLREAQDMAGYSVRARLQETLLPLWEEIMRVLRRIEAGRPDLFAALAESGRVASPSDFGLHNAIEAADGELRFVDFEFAGWDDPAKLCCDFASQPDNIPALSLAGQFSQALARIVPDELLPLRVELLMPVFQLKWVCIILNIFRPVGLARQDFTRGKSLEERCGEQMTKMEAMLIRIRDSLDRISSRFPGEDHLEA